MTFDTTPGWMLRATQYDEDDRTLTMAQHIALHSDDCPACLEEPAGPPTSGDLCPRCCAEFERDLRMLGILNRMES